MDTPLDPPPRPTLAQRVAVAAVELPPMAPVPRPWSDWRWVAAMAAVIAALGLGAFGVGLARTNGNQDAQNDLSNCRATVSGAQLVALAEWALALSDTFGGDDSPEAEAAYLDAQAALRQANAARRQFDQDPTAEFCQEDP